MLQHVYTLDQNYEVVEFDKSGIFGDHPPNAQTVPSMAAILPWFGALASFWGSFVAQVQRCENMLGRVDTVSEAITQRRLTRPLATTMREDYFFAIDAFERVKTLKDGLLNMAHTHLKRKQLLQVTHAIDTMVRFDMRALAKRLRFNTDKAAKRIEALVSALFSEIIPRAIASLWLWKTSERNQSTVNIDTDTTRLLWMSILKLRAIALMSEDLTVTQLFAECIVPTTRRTVTDPNKPVVRYSMRELWTTIRRISWDWPLILPGAITRRYLDAIWWRCAILASQALPRSVMDHGPLVSAVTHANGATPGKAPIFRVSDHFVNETERICYFIFDNLWTLQWFELQRTPATVAAPSTAQLKHSRVLPEWNQFTMRSLSEKVSEFVKLDFSSRIWAMNARRDEIERYNLDTRTTQGNPIKSLIYYHQSDYDFVLGVSNSMPVNVWGPAMAQIEREIATARYLKSPLEAAEGVEPELECRWRPVWELRADYERTRTKETRFDTFSVEVGTSGEKHFIDNQTRRRLRGDQAQAAALIFTSHTMCAGKNELDAISEAVLLVQMQASGEKDSPLLRVYRDSTDNITLDVLPNRHEVLAHIETANPRIMRIANSYVVYDGKVTLARVPFLDDALRVWCHHVDAFVDHQLHKIGLTGHQIAQNMKLSNDPRANMLKVLEYATKSVQAIPHLLRVCYGLSRDPITFQRLESSTSAQTSGPWFAPELARQFRKHDLWPRTDGDSNIGYRRDGDNSPRKRRTSGTRTEEVVESLQW